MRPLVAPAVLGVVLSSIGAAHAQMPAPDAPSETARAANVAPRLVRVTIAGDSDPGATEATLRDLFGHLPEGLPPVALDVTVVPELDPASITAPPARPPPAFARAWIDMRADTCVVSIADAPWERIHQRIIPRPPGNDGVTREETAQIVISAVEAMLAGGVIGVARAEVAPPVPSKPGPRPSPPLAPPLAPPPRAPAPSRPGASLGAGYEAIAFASGVIAHGPSTSLRGTLPAGRLVVGLEVAAQWRAPVVVERDPIGLRLDTKALRLAVDAAWEVAPRLALRAGVGPGVDVNEIEPRASVGSVEGTATTIVVEAKRSRVTPVLRWSVGLDVRVTSSAHVVLTGVLEHALLNRAYVVREQGVERDVLAPFDLRPGLRLSLVGDLIRP
ncbi:MAG: hypothetical protein KF795_18260 [Labilithrix sp.]|nr:hypothetical protein [Labilithrix sp.]